MRPQSPRPEIHVDSHTHVLPARLASKIRGFFESSGMVSASATPTSCCSVPSDTIPLVYPIDGPKLLSILISESAPHTFAPAIWTLPYAHRADMSLALNASVLDLARELTLAGEGKMRVLPGLTVHPGDGEAGGLKAEEVLEVAVQAGAKVAKLHCSVGEYSVMDVRLECVLSSLLSWMELTLSQAVLATRGGPSTPCSDPRWNFHYGNNGISGTRRHFDPLRRLPLCPHHPRSVPSSPFFFHTNPPTAHAGHPSTYRALELTRLHPNLHLDTTPVISSLVSLPPLPSPP